MLLIFILTGIFSIIYFPLISTVLGSNYVLLSIILFSALFVYGLLKPEKEIDQKRKIITASRRNLDIWRTIGLPENIADIMEMRINETDRFFRENRNFALSTDVFIIIRLMFIKVNRMIFATKTYS